METPAPRPSRFSTATTFISGGIFFLCAFCVCCFAFSYWYGGLDDGIARVPRPTATPRPSRTAVPDTPTPIPLLPTVGEAISAGGVSLTVHSLTATVSSDIADPADGHYFLVIDTAIENTERENGAAYSPLYFSVKDTEGFEYEATFNYIDPALHAGNMPLGDKVRGNVVFEVPLTVTSLTLAYTPLVIGGGYETIRIDLGEPPRP